MATTTQKQLDALGLRIDKEVAARTTAVTALALRATKLEADVKTLLAAAGGGGGTTPVPNPPPLPTTGPAITNLAIAGISTTSATVSWSVSPDANGQVEYGLTTGYGSTTTLEASLLPAHSQTLSGLTPNTTYHVRVRSQAATGPVSVSSDRSFTTAQTTPIPTPPPSALLFGSGVGYETKSNERIDGSNKQAYGFVADHTGLLESIALNLRGGAGYSLGDGGTQRWTLQSDSAGRPSGTVLGTLQFNPGNPGGNWESKARHNFDAAAMTILGTQYWLVGQNVHASPASNYVSWNVDLAWNPADTPRQPAFPDTFATMRNTGGGFNLQNGYLAPFDLEWSDGHHQGNQYFAVILSEYGLIGGTNNKCRIRFDNPATRTFAGLGFQARLNSGSGSLTARLEKADGTEIETLVIPSSRFKVVAPGDELTSVPWTYTDFVANRTFATGIHNILFTAPAGTQYSVMPHRSSDSDMVAAGWGGYYFPYGAGAGNGSSVQDTTNGGSSWADLYPFDRVDMAFYLRDAA